MIELVKPEWAAGSERRFLNFIKKLSVKDKIAIISHTDADGLIAAKVASKVIGTNNIRFLGYSELNLELIEKLKAEKVNKIFMTDLSWKDKKLLRKAEKFAKIVIVDHHTFDQDFNSPKTVFMNAQGFCSGYLCYYLFSKVKDLSKIDWLVACASVADWMFVKNEAWLSKIYKEYGEEFSPLERNIKFGKFWDLQYNISLAILYFKKEFRRVFDSFGENFGDIGDLEKYAQVINSQVNNAINDFYIKKENIHDGYFMEFDSDAAVGAIVVNLLSSKTPNKTFIIAKEEEEVYKISSRRQDGKVDLPKMLQKLVEGFEGASAGGHLRAAGANFLAKDKDKFKERLRKL